MFRSDSRLIRVLAKGWGAHAALGWQQPPLLTLPEDLIPELLTYKDRALRGEFNKDNGILVPWNDVVLNLPGGFRALDTHKTFEGKSRHAWIRVSSAELIARPAFARSSP